MDKLAKKNGVNFLLVAVDNFHGLSELKQRKHNMPKALPKLSQN